MKNTKQTKKINTDVKLIYAKLKDGVTLHPFGLASVIDNSNLTNEIATLLLKKGRAKKEDFITLPNN